MLLAYIICKCKTPVAAKLLEFSVEIMRFNFTLYPINIKYKISITEWIFGDDDVSTFHMDCGRAVTQAARASNAIAPNVIGKWPYVLISIVFFAM